MSPKSVAFLYINNPKVELKEHFHLQYYLKNKILRKNLTEEVKELYFEKL